MKRRPTGCTLAGFDLSYGYNSYACLVRQCLLIPIEEGSRSAALFRGKHPWLLSKTTDSIKSVEKRLTLTSVYIRYLHLKKILGSIMQRATLLRDRRKFIGGSDARIIMGSDEAA
jgi:hypothetical protein